MFCQLVPASRDRTYSNSFHSRLAGTRDKKMNLRSVGKKANYCTPVSLWAILTRSNPPLPQGRRSGCVAFVRISTNNEHIIAAKYVIRLSSANPSRHAGTGNFQVKPLPLVISPPLFKGRIVLFFTSHKWHMLARDILWAFGIGVLNMRGGFAA